MVGGRFSSYTCYVLNVKPSFTGGGCNVCGSPKHLKRDCPELAAQKQKKDERSKRSLRIVFTAKPVFMACLWHTLREGCCNDLFVVEPVVER